MPTIPIRMKSGCENCRRKFRNPRGRRFYPQSFGRQRRSAKLVRGRDFLVVHGLQLRDRLRGGCAGRNPADDLQPRAIDDRLIEQVLEVRHRCRLHQDGKKQVGDVPTSSPKNSGGVMPITVKRVPEIAMSRPIADGDNPKRRFQYP